jgi:hypothetical protein
MLVDRKKGDPAPAYFPLKVTIMHIHGMLPLVPLAL